MWIFNNVRAKWDSIVRRPHRLMEMFSGYHARPSVITAALERCGVAVPQLAAELPSWEPAHLHRLVAHFLRIRFPILLCCNKADMSQASRHIKDIRARFPHEQLEAVSAKAEHALCQLRRQGLVEFLDGADKFEVVQARVSELPDAKRQQVAATLQYIEAHVLRVLGSTGVLKAMNKAVQLKPPLLVFPVEDLESCITPLLSLREMKDAVPERGVLRDCLQMRPGTVQ